MRLAMTQPGFSSVKHDFTSLLMFQMRLRYESSLSAGGLKQGPLALFPLQGIHGDCLMGYLVYPNIIKRKKNSYIHTFGSTTLELSRIRCNKDNDKRCYFLSCRKRNFVGRSGDKSI